MPGSALAGEYGPLIEQCGGHEPYLGDLHILAYALAYRCGHWNTLCRPQCLPSREDNCDMQASLRL
jgi:hypothetical protein